MLADGKALKLFDPTQPAILRVDNLQNVIGPAILQNGEPLEFASCSLNSVQKAFAQIEFLAIQYRLHKFHQYIYGQICCWN